ncbi:hypothetical protein EDD80_12411 [Anseongella ginsenosidimutans]|uniref:Uncharacterized protein n=1 Tax=Anseongella ginsenosidimutans TaxID=496056 RepID=A0A4R3KJU1_9SPHI|nr:hypothetical protein [Anseongella ginsenosidimutans]QEC53609.1 hypothetical protein FRZ59_15550 [Anseongella ginsenosidimutans]TCS83954.1 hypothetical protein EDD80_12411 [Anseongella ginsenosidimutans]
MKKESPYNEAQLLGIWEQIGQRNYWIRQAIDPPFDKTQLIKCDTLEDLQLSLQQTAWCLGQGFYYQQLCFINQISGGDEWLTIKDDYAFESISFARVIEAGKFEGLIERLLKASKNQCLRLHY